MRIFKCLFPFAMLASQLTSTYFTVQFSTSYAAFEESSNSGTVVVRGQHDDFDSPRTPKSRLGIREKTYTASLEDSAINLLEVVLP